MNTPGFLIWSLALSAASAYAGWLLAKARYKSSCDLCAQAHVVPWPERDQVFECPMNGQIPIDIIAEDAWYYD